MKRQAARTALVVAVVLVLGSGVALAQSENCGIVGTWMARLPNGSSFIAVVTRSANPASGVGQIDLGWIAWEPTLASRFPAVRTTDPKGVWEKVDDTRVNTTWVAYGLGADGVPLYVLRVRGFATLVGCERATFTTTADLFLPAHDIWTAAPLVSIGPEVWTARRMPVVPPPPQEEQR